MTLGSICLPPRPCTKYAIAVGVVTLAVEWLEPASSHAQPAEAAISQSATAAGDAADSSAGLALESVFNPRRAPAKRTMGLLQRSFLDLVETSQPKLQIALVIDGTESMGTEIEGVRNTITALMDDIELYKQNNVTYQIVVYRDVGAASGAVSFPLGGNEHAFTADREAVKQAAATIKAESGAPYFHELADMGVHAALTQLAWADADDVSRWLLVIGDAPPFDAAFREPENQAERHFATDQLVAVATAKKIRINCILCQSRPEDRRAYEAVLASTRDFMSTLSSLTGGVMLDMSYDDIRKALSAAGPRQPVQFQRVGYIERSDIQRVLEQSAAGPLDPDARVRLAILPHLPLGEMSFDPDNPGVQLATELRHRFRSISGFSLQSPRMVQRRFELLADRGLSGESLLQTLGKALRVDYVVWGSLDNKQGILEATTRIYDRVGGTQLVEVIEVTNPDRPPSALGGQLAEQLIAQTVSTNADERLVARFASLERTPATRTAVFRQIVDTPAAHEPLMAGMEALEQALAYPIGDETGKKLLATAADRLEAAADADSANGLAQFLLASCYYNQAKDLKQQGREQEGNQAMARFASALRKAFQLRTKLNHAGLQDEIEADYWLLIRRDIPKAIAIYRKLADAQTPELHAARRGHWMLAGIYAGDWGVPPEYIDANQAKQHLTTILALWPDSPEAEYIKKNLRWDDAEQKTRFPNLPQANENVTDAF